MQTIVKEEIKEYSPQEKKGMKMELKILDAAITKLDINKQVPKTPERDGKIIELHRNEYVQAIVSYNALGKGFISEIKITHKGLKRRAEIQSIFKSFDQ